MTSRKPSSEARIAALAAVMVLSGCASTSSAIRNGSAKLLPNAVTGAEGDSFLYAVIEVNGERRKISVNTAGCVFNVGTIFANAGFIDVLRDGDRPEDRLFRQICDAANVAPRPRPR
jgi:hypothetical protein